MPGPSRRSPRARVFAAAACLAAAAAAPLPFACDAAATGTAATPATAPATAPADGGFVPLFNGKDLTGWVVTACKVKAEDGKLVLVEGNGLVRSEMRYGDFVLELEWRNLKADKYDSGVYFRSPPKKLKRYPDKYQINLLQGEEGSIVTNKQVKVVGNAAVKGMAKPGEWNRMRLTCVGTKAELEINGKQAWQVDGIAPAVGFIGIQCEVEAGGPFEFRDIRVKALTPPQPAEEE